MRLYNPIIGLLFVIFIIYLICYAIWYVWVFYIKPFLIEVVFPIVSVLIILFLVSAFGYSLVVVVRDVVWSFKQVRTARQSAAPVLFRDEAQIGYVFGPAWEDVRAFFGHCFSRGRAHVSDAATRISSADHWIKSLFYCLDWLFAVTFGMLTTILVTATMAVVGALTAFVLSVIFVVLYVVDLAYLSVRGVFAQCPVCDTRSFHLYYDCPSCGGRPQRHRYLRPNRAGALYHTCTCGAKVPAHVLTGRGRNMKAFCTHQDEHAISGALIGTNVTNIAMVGGPDSGKSTLLVGVLRHLFRHKGHFSKKFRLDDEIQQRIIDGWIKDLEGNVCPPKTTAERHRATTVLFEGGAAERNSLYFFDTSGEMFSSTKLMATHTYFKRPDLILFALDPLSLEGFLAQVRSSLDSTKIRDASPSRERPLAVASSLISLMDANGAKRVNGQFEAPLELILTKSDLIQSQSDLNTSEKLAAWITRYGGGELLRLLEVDFNEIRFSHVSGLTSTMPGKGGELARLADGIVAHAENKSKGQRMSLRRRA